MPASLLTSLIDVNDCLLIVIDVQTTFLQKLRAAQRQQLVNRIGWLVQVAEKLGVPMMATAEDMAKLGGLVPSIAEKLLEGTCAEPGAVAVYNKMVFGLADQPDILAAVEKTKRKTAVLVGLETDVCIAHSALGLLQRGYQVIAVTDATASPGDGHTIGLERMRRAGVLLVTTKSLFYEWVRTVEASEAFWAKYRDEFAWHQQI